MEQNAPSSVPLRRTKALSCGNIMNISAIDVSSCGISIAPSPITSPPTTSISPSLSSGPNPLSSSATGKKSGSLAAATAWCKLLVLGISYFPYSSFCVLHYTGRAERTLLRPRGHNYEKIRPTNYPENETQLQPGSQRGLRPGRARTPRRPSRHPLRRGRIRPFDPQNRRRLEALAGAHIRRPGPVVRLGSGQVGRRPGPPHLPETARMRRPRNAVLCISPGQFQNIILEFRVFPGICACEVM